MNIVVLRKDILIYSEKCNISGKCAHRGLYMIKGSPFCIESLPIYIWESIKEVRGMKETLI
jgi:hypothetical protein